MTLVNLVEHKVLLKELASQSLAKDQYLQNTFGLSDECFGRIKKIRDSSGSIFQKSFAAAKILKEGLESRVEKEKILLSAQFSQDTLAGLIFDDWEEPGYKALAVGTAIKKEYRMERTSLSQRTGLRIPGIHLFREELGVYEGNLVEAKACWPKIQVSNHDWHDSIRIPLEFNPSLAFLLGVIWADGIPTEKGENNSPHIHLLGGEGDTPFYENTLVPLVYELFNKRVNSLTQTKSDYCPVLALASKAISTFIEEHCQFPKKKKDYPLPDFGLFVGSNLPEKESLEELLQIKKSFFRGLMAGMAKPYIRKKEFWVRLFDEDLIFVNSIHRLVGELGLEGKYSAIRDPRDYKTIGRVSFYGERARELYRQGYMVNPKHFSTINTTNIFKAQANKINF